MSAIELDEISILASQKKMSVSNFCANNGCEENGYEDQTCQQLSPACEPNVLTIAPIAVSSRI